MKRLAFKAEFVPMILDGTKTATSRWSDKKLKVGDKVAAVTAQKGKPAFLIPAADGFAILEITEAFSCFFNAYDGNMARACGFTTIEEATEWYRQERPTANEFDRLYYYGFRRVEPTP